MWGIFTGASLVIVSEARGMREEALERAHEKKRELETERLDPGETQTASIRGNMQSQIVGIESRIKELRELEVGAFSHWYQQPIFAALVSCSACSAPLALPNRLSNFLSGERLAISEALD